MANSHQRAETIGADLMDDSSNSYSVYYHRNKLNGKVYVGKAKNIQKRWGRNGNGYTRNHDTVFSNAVRKYGWDNFDHVIIRSGLSCEEASLIESYYIDLWKTNVCKHGNSFGYNMTDGGEGSAGLSTGCKPVFCVTTGELYRSVTSAANENGISVTHLSAVCRGRKSSANGLIWRYATQADIDWYNTNGNPIYNGGERDAIINTALETARARQNIDRIMHSNKPVLCKDLGIIYPSVKAASLAYKVDMREISKSATDEARGVETMAAEHLWKFVKFANNKGVPMQDKFIYVFSDEDKDKLLSLGYTLLQSCEQQNMFVFQSNGDMNFLNGDIAFVLSNMLTFNG